MSTVLSQSTSQALREIREIPMYTKAELTAMRQSGASVDELKKAKAKKKYDYDVKYSNADDLVAQNLNLALKIAKRYQESCAKQSIPLDDIFSVACEGLAKASTKYDFEHESGAKFATYAYNWIRKYVLDYLNVGASPVKVTVHEGFSRVLAKCSFVSKDAQFGDFDDNPVNNELRSSTSTDALHDNDLHASRVSDEIHLMLEVLTPAEKYVLCQSYGIGGAAIAKSVKEIASQMSIRPVDVKSYLSSAIDRIAEYVKTFPEARQAYLQSCMAKGIDFDAYKQRENIEEFDTNYMMLQTQHEDAIQETVIYKDELPDVFDTNDDSFRLYR